MSTQPGSFDDLPVLTEVVVPSPMFVEKTEEHPDFSETIPLASEEEAEEPLPSEPLPIEAPLPDPEPEEEDDDDEETQGSDFPTDFSDIREALIEAVQKRISVEIPTLVEASLQNSLPTIMQDIQEGLEESAKMALRDLIVSLRKKSPPAKR